jgi:hypothetical protein
MDLTITGRLFRLEELIKGEGQRGPWTKQAFIIETIETYAKKIVFTAWNERVDTLTNFRIGEVLQVSFRPESREYNNRWYTDLIAWKIETVGNIPANSVSSSTTSPTSNDIPETSAPQDVEETDLSISDDGDMPF